MQLVEPEVYLISRPQIDWDALDRYLTGVGGTEWSDGRLDDLTAGDGQDLVEAAGRACYRSWKPGLNPNVTRVRTDQAEYLENILASGHGSVLEHANYTFAFRSVSRVLTTELNRHRAGTAISQESGRYVRLADIPAWLPEWARTDQILMDAIRTHLFREEAFQQWLAAYFHLDDPGLPFAEKKAKTSFMRRWAPEGRANDEIWTANIRALRHVIEKRTDPAAEEEIRLVFGQVADIMIRECPRLFGDFTRHPDGTYAPKHPKV